jgi:hypothetical protein
MASLARPRLTEAFRRAVVTDEQGTGRLPSPFAGGAALGEAYDEQKPGDDGKKGHRRGRSLSSIMLNPLKMKGRRASLADELDVSGLHSADVCC